MTQVAIKKQIAAIHTATAKATKSQSSALKFLKDAGILPQLTKSKTTASHKVVAKK